MNISTEKTPRTFKALNNTSDGSQFIKSFNSFNSIDLLTHSTAQMGTVTPVSPKPAHVSPLNEGTSVPIWLNNPSMLTNPSWPVTSKTNSCRNSHSGRASPGG